MDLLKALLLTVALVSVGFVMVGFYRPFWVVWWENVQNRKKVLKVYGTAALIFYAGYWAVTHFL